MFWRMLRDDGNRMANVRRAHKVKVKRREDKVWKVSDYAPVRPEVGKQNIGKTKGKGEREREQMEKRMCAVPVTRNISRENRHERAKEDYRRYCAAARTTWEKIMACDEAMR